MPRDVTPTASHKSRLVSMNASWVQHRVRGHDWWQRLCERGLGRKLRPFRTWARLHVQTRLHLS